MKMRRESLGQILSLRRALLTPSRHRMILRERRDLTGSPGNSPIVLSPRKSSAKKRPAPGPPDTPNKVPKMEAIEAMEVATPNKTDGGQNQEVGQNTEEGTTPKRDMLPPPMPNIQLRAKLAKKLHNTRSSWKTLSLSRKEKVKRGQSAQMFSSPSIYESNQDTEDVMTSYLSGKICPLTPSQQPTNVSHLVSKEPELGEPGQKENSGSNYQENMETEQNSTTINHPVVTAQESMASYCNVM